MPTPKSLRQAQRALQQDAALPPPLPPTEPRKDVEMAEPQDKDEGQQEEDEGMVAGSSSVRRNSDAMEVEEADVSSSSATSPATNLPSSGSVPISTGSQPRRVTSSDPSPAGDRLRRIGSSRSIGASSSKSSRSSGVAIAPISSPHVASPRVDSVAVSSEPTTPASDISAVEAISAPQRSKSNSSFKHFIGGIFRSGRVGAPGGAAPTGQEEIEKTRRPPGGGAGGPLRTPKIRTRSERSTDSSMEDLGRSRSRSRVRMGDDAVEEGRRSPMDVSTEARGGDR